METIRNYLETMFANLPNTPEVQKAKMELWQMMEDKYTELIGDGKSENEAVGVVISEFGNLDELAEELGIRSFIMHDKAALNTVKNITLAQVKDYLRDRTRSAYAVALGVFLCIISSCGNFLAQGKKSGIYGICFMFIAVAAGVGLFMLSHFGMGKWKFLKTEPCSVDFATTDYVHNRRENFRMTYAMMLTIGVILCVLCVLPVIASPILRVFNEGVSVALMFVIVGIGVFLIVAAANVNGGFTAILSLNKSDTMGGSFVPSQKQVGYRSERAAAIMSVYWPTVTCIYLSWSFLSFDWHITWIVWVIAPLVHQLVRAFLM